jgi:hypothetical protein
VGAGGKEVEASSYSGGSGVPAGGGARDGVEALCDPKEGAGDRGAAPVP